MLRTDGNQTQVLTWSMFSGTTVANASQKARFFLSPSSLTQTNLYGTGATNSAFHHLMAESSLDDVVLRAAGANNGATPGPVFDRFRVTAAFYQDAHLADLTSITRVAISARAATPITEPLSMLHIGEFWTSQTGGHRSWMNTGTYIQRRNDNVFFGIRPRENSAPGTSDQNDAIVAWGDDDNPVNRLDALRFVFAGTYSASALPGQAAHLYGLETMRIHPKGNIGMGDFSLNGLNQTPTEKLDVVGNIRVRAIPSDSLEVIIMDKQQTAAGDYKLRYLNLPNNGDVFLNGNGTFTAAIDKDWDFDANNVRTGVGTGGFPGGNVGVGVTGSAAQAKLDVKGTVGSLFTTVGINVLSAASTAIAIGLQAIASNGPSANFASRSESFSSSASANYGVFGNACNATTNYAIYGASCGSSSTNYAGYFDGNVTVNGIFSNPSDLNLKSNIQPIANATTKLLALNPVTYEFNEDASPLNLPVGNQFGLVAQEVAVELPELVVHNVHPAQYDSLGNEISAAFEYLSVRSGDLTPIIISGFKEQHELLEAKTEEVNQLQNEVQELQSQLQQMQAQMASMQTVLQAVQAKTNNCCSEGSTGTLPSPSENSDGMKLMQNVPNPFDSYTRIDFTLPAVAYVVLELSDAQGRPLRRLVDGQMSSGQQSIVLDGTSLAPGIYFYTVSANGELLTKKMVKK